MARASDNGKFGMQDAVMPNYIRSAPQPLIDIHKRRGSAIGDDFLFRLLTDRRMHRPWLELGKVVRDAQDWEWVLRKIMERYRVSQWPVQSRHTRVKRLESIALQAQTLVKSLQYERRDIHALDDHLSLQVSIEDVLGTIVTYAEIEVDKTKRSPQAIEHRTRDSKAIHFGFELTVYFTCTRGRPMLGTATAIANVAFNTAIQRSQLQARLKRTMRAR